MYQYFSQCYGTKSFSQKPKKRPRRHARHLKDLTQKKNEARRRMKKARKEGGSEAAVHALAKEFHKLLSQGMDISFIATFLAFFILLLASFFF